MPFKPLHLVLLLLVLLSRLNRSVPCGVPRPPRNHLIVNGRDTVPGQWPWHAALYHRKHVSDRYLCGGTLIGEWFVLTAAHCTLNPDNHYQLPTAEFFIRLGVHNLNRLNKVSLQEHSVDRIFKADRFKAEALRDDIALLRLGTKADFDQYVQPACLNREPYLVGQFGTAIGWGLTEHNSLASVLRSARMPVIEDNTCLASDRDNFSGVLDAGIFCAGYTTGTAVCNGDSGGGLFFQRRGVWYVGGIVSFSTAREDDDRVCNSKGYGAFTKVSKYLSWIRSVTGTELTPDDGESANGNLEAPAFSLETSSIRPMLSIFNDRPQIQATHGMIQKPEFSMLQNIPQLWDNADGNDTFTKHEWSSHRVDEDPQTGEVIRKETRYNVTINRRTETNQPQTGNLDVSGFGPLISTLIRDNGQQHDSAINDRIRDFFNSESSPSGDSLFSRHFDTDRWK